MFEEDLKEEEQGRPHAKRIGREQLINFFFMCKMHKEEPSVSAFVDYCNYTMRNHGSNDYFSLQTDDFAVKFYNRLISNEKKKEKISMVVQRRYAKRVGRELAMQYLFECEVCQQIPSIATFEPFYEQAVKEYDLVDSEEKYVSITEDEELTNCSSILPIQGEDVQGQNPHDVAVMLYELVTLHREEIDKVIAERCQHWDLDRLSLVDRNILRIAIGEMLFDEEIPPVVSIDEAVEIARDYSGEDAGNFINGVLNAVKNTLKRSPRTAMKNKK